MQSTKTRPNGASAFSGRLHITRTGTLRTERVIDYHIKSGPLAGQTFRYRITTEGHAVSRRTIYGAVLTCTRAPSGPLLSEEQFGFGSEVGARAWAFEEIGRDLQRRAEEVQR